MEKINSFDVRVENIRKIFGQTVALNNVSFKVDKGTIHALVGENGSGKSSLMRILAGVHQVDEGQIYFNDEEVKFFSPADSIDTGISMVYQELNLVSDLTVADNIFLGKEFSFFVPGVIKNHLVVKETEKLLKKFEIFSINPLEKIENLSIAECQIVEFLKAIVKKSFLIIMDEPTSSLSYKEVQFILETIKKLKKAGYSIIYISHHLDEVRQISDEVTVLRDGEVVYSGRTKNISNKEIIKHMVGRELKDYFVKRNSFNKNKKIIFSVDNLSDGNRINNISLNIGAGEILGMYGLIGAGRTEIAELIFGIKKAHSGNVYIHGKKTKIKSPRDAVKKRMAFLTEDRKRTGLLLSLPNMWNVTLPTLGKYFRSYWLDHFKEISISTTEVSKMSVKWGSPLLKTETLSGGNQQKLLIVRWLLASSDIVIFDEPTRGIDVGAKKEIYEIMNSLASQGKAILLISSELDEILGVSDRVLVVRDFFICKEFKASKLSQNEIMNYATGEL